MNCAAPGNCPGCPLAANEQACLNAWADKRFGQRQTLASLAARVTREAALMTEFALRGDTDLLLDELTFSIVLAYRIADACGVDLWQQVAAKVAELQCSTDLGDRF
jgi:hypothetical protein